MIQKTLISSQNDVLLLFFAGWAADEHLFEFYTPKGIDFMVCYDYRNLEFDVNLLQGYRSIHVCAWSMGVWAASQVLTRYRLPITTAVAINGTPQPVDNLKGIPATIFQGTLQGLDLRNLKKFQRRMSATSADHRAFMAHIPQRPLDEMIEELAHIGRQASEFPIAHYTWTKAIVGSEDRIIPPENQQRVWKEHKVDVELQAIAHYDASLFQTLIENTFYE
jgi:hypothetical protein